MCDSANHGICSLCNSTYCNGMEHGTAYGQCFNLNTSALITCLKCSESYYPSARHLDDCNLHYTCQTGTSTADHACCYRCGGYMCDGNDQSIYSLCGEYMCNSESCGTGDDQCSPGMAASDVIASGSQASRTNSLPMIGMAAVGLACLLPSPQEKAAVIQPVSRPSALCRRPFLMAVKIRISVHGRSAFMHDF